MFNLHVANLIDSDIWSVHMNKSEFNLGDDFVPTHETSGRDRMVLASEQNVEMAWCVYVI